MEWALSIGVVTKANKKVLFMTLVDHIQGFICIEPSRVCSPPPPRGSVSPPKDLQKLIKIHEISQLNANSSCLNCTPHVHYVVLKCYLGAFMGTLILIYALASRALRRRGHPPPPRTHPLGPLGAPLLQLLPCFPP